MPPTGRPISRRWQTKTSGFTSQESSPRSGNPPAWMRSKRRQTLIAFGESKGAMSQNGDLGFLWGEYRVGAATAATGDYLRIWRKDEQGGWKLMLDLLHPR